jgi:hypothetical protein
MDQLKRIYRAIANDPDDSASGLRVTVLAANFEEASCLLIERYGKGSFIDLHSDEEATRKR